MAKKEEVKKAPQSAPAAGNVANIVVDRCKTEGCKSKAVRAGFCDEHYMWFKEGLVTVDGHYAKDFEKKYQQFTNRKKKAS